jgi:hypothetical protein
MASQSSNGSRRGDWEDDDLDKMTLADFQRLERSLYRRPGYLDEPLYWWLVEQMLKRMMIPLGRPR